MRIRQNERFRPFSHTPGVKCPLPGTPFIFQIYPACLKVFQDETLLEELCVNLLGPVHDFTVQLDLERDFIKVWGTSIEGFFCYAILPEGSDWKVKVEKGFAENLFDPSKVTTDPLPQALAKERLFLGCQKHQHWERIKTAAEPAEVLPFLYALGQRYGDEQATGGTIELVESLATVDKVQWCEAFTTFFKVGFEGILSPRKRDEDHLGIDFHQSYQGSASALINRAQAAIRDLFIYGSVILPRVPPQFHCGKFVSVKLGSHLLDIEWTKKSLRRMIIKTGKTEELTLIFPKEMKRYRLRNTLQGKQMSTSEVLSLEEGQVYYLDCFEA